MSVFSIFSGKTQHPLVDLKEMRRICADLVAREPLNALEEAATWLEALVEFDEIRVQFKIEAFDVVFRIQHTRWFLARSVLRAPSRCRW